MSFILQVPFSQTGWVTIIIIIVVYSRHLGTKSLLQVIEGVTSPFETGLKSISLVAMQKQLFYTESQLFYTVIQ